MKITDKTVNICKYPLIKKKKKKRKGLELGTKGCLLTLFGQKKRKNTNSREGFSISLVFKTITKKIKQSLEKSFLVFLNS